MNFFVYFIIFLISFITLISAIEYGEIKLHRIEKRQFNFGQWGRNMGQRSENYGRSWGRQW